MTLAKKHQRTRLAMALCACSTGFAFAADHDDLPAAEHTLAEVVVAAKSIAEIRAESPNPVFAIGRDEIDATNDLTLGDFLRRQPGITFTGPPGDPKDIRLMGMDKGYTQILINGVAVPGGGKERQIQVDQIPMTMIERVEIVRSPLPDQPADGIAGTINIITREAHSDSLQVRLSGGVIKSEKDTSPNGNVQVTWGVVRDNASLTVPLSVIRRHELKTKPKITEQFNAGTGVRTALTEEYENENNDVREISLAPELTLKAGADDTLKFSLFGNNNDGSKHKTKDSWTSLTPATGGNFVTGNREVEDEDKERFTYRAGTEWKHAYTPALTSTLSLMAQHAGENKNKVKDTFDPTGNQTATETEDSTSRSDNLTFAARADYSGLKQHKLGAGLQLARDARDDKKDKFTNGVLQTPSRGDIFKVDEDKLALWLRDDWTLAPKHLLVSGLRWQRNQVSSDDGAGHVREDTVQSNPTPSLSYRWQAHKQLTLRAAAAYTFKPPKFDDISSIVQSASGINSVTNPDISGNPALAPEEALGFDLGVDIFSRDQLAQLGLSASQRRIENLIASDTRYESDIGRWVQRPYNMPGTSTVNTMAVDGRYDLRQLGLSGFILSGNYSHFDSKAYDPTTQSYSGRVKDQPPYAWNAGLDWGIPFVDATLGARYNFLPETEKSNGDIESAQKILDMFLTWTLSPRYTVRFNATNLLDTSKLKDKPKYTSGVLTERTRELEKGGRKFLLSLDMNF
jgi:outer membrane receptor for ferrienterochelin and colicins